MAGLVLRLLGLRAACPFALALVVGNLQCTEEVSVSGFSVQPLPEGYLYQTFLEATEFLLQPFLWLSETTLEELDASLGPESLGPREGQRVAG